MKQMVTNGFTKLIVICVFFIVCAISLVNIVFDATMEFQTAQFTYTQSLFSINTLVAILAFMFIIFSFPLTNKKHKKWLPYMVLTGFTVVACLFIWLMINPGKPTDSFDVYQAALSWTENGAPNDPYFVNFPYQFGLIQLIYGLIKIFNDEILVTTIFRCINLTALIIIGNILLDLTKRITKESWTYLFIPIYGCFFAPFLLVTFVYGDLIGLCFAMIAVWLYTTEYSHHGNIKFVFTLLSLLLAIYFRLNSSIFGIALAIYALFSKSNYKDKLLGFAGFLITTLIGLNLDSIILEWFYHVETFDIPMIARLAMGLDANGAGLREPGWYNGYIIQLLDQYGNNPDLIKHQAMNDLINSLQTFINQPAFAIDFFIRKFSSMFLLADFEGFSMNFITYENTWNFLGMTIDGSYFIFWYNQISRIAFLMICFGSIAGIVRQFKNHHVDITWLLMLIVFGGITYHMLFEAKSRYVLPYMLLMIPISIFGFKTITEKLLKQSFKIPHPSIIKAILIVTSLVLLFISYEKTILPTLYFEGYTDTQIQTPLNNGSYYRYPFSIESPVSITDISLLTYKDTSISEDAFVLVEIYDNNNTCLGSRTISATELQDKSWTTISLTPTQLDIGDYFIQVSSNNPALQNYGLILGNQYTFINEKNMLLNNYEIDLQGNIKLYKNH